MFSISFDISQEVILVANLFYQLHALALIRSADTEHKCVEKAIYKTSSSSSHHHHHHQQQQQHTVPWLEVLVVWSGEEY